MLTTPVPALWRRLAYPLLSLIGLAAILRSALFVRRNLCAPAWFDFWQWVADYQRWVEGRFTFHDLIKPHNDTHRIATTRLVLLLDSIFFGMNGWLPVITSFAMLLAIGWMVGKLAARDGAPVLIPTLIWMALACSTCQWDNLVFPFQVQFPITCALACGCAWLLTAAAGAPKGRAAALGMAAGLGAILADFSMASGILLAPPLLLLLAIRRARWEAWAAFTPLCALGVVLYEHHLPPIPGPPLLGWQLNWTRVRYSGDFLASDLNGFSETWTWIAGLALLTALLCAGAILLRTYSVRRKAIPSGDAALLALGLWVAACGPAGSFTQRITYGPVAALVGRYATMSLLFASVLLALAARGWARHGARPSVRSAFCLLALGGIVLFNLPTYDTRAGGLQRVIATDAELLVNNITVEGPAAQTYVGTTPAIRVAEVFLHASGRNMFAPENGPPALAVAEARSAHPDTLPVCRGGLDDGYALDATGFLLRGWAMDASGKHAATWIAAIEGANGLIGMARPLAFLPGAQARRGQAEGPAEFESGFRFPVRASPVDGGRPVQVVALFSGRPLATCKLTQAARIGPLRIVPATALQRGVALAETAASVTGGFAPLPDTAGQDGPGAPRGGLWRYDGSGSGALRLAFPPGTGLGRAVAVPFSTSGEAPGRRMVLQLADGTQASIDLSSLWGRADWRAVEIPRDMVVRHGGLAFMDVHGAGAGSLSVGMPLAADVDEDWARLF